MNLLKVTTKNRSIRGGDRVTTKKVVRKLREYFWRWGRHLGLLAPGLLRHKGLQCCDACCCSDFCRDNPYYGCARIGGCRASVLRQIQRQECTMSQRLARRLRRLGAGE